MAFAHDRRAQVAVFTAVGAVLVGLTWLGVMSTDAVEVTEEMALVSGIVVAGLLVSIVVWLFLGALEQVVHTVRGRPEEDEEQPYFVHAPYKRHRGLRR